MTVNKLNEYAPNYPKKSGKALKLGTLAAAALLAASIASGCTVSVSGYLQGPPAVTDEPLTPEPTDELCVPGEPAVDENGDIIDEEPALMGDVRADPALGLDG